MSYLGHLQGVLYDLIDKKQYLGALELSFQTASLSFKIKSLDDFMALRKNRELKKYAVSFRKYAENRKAEFHLYKAMSDAIETSDLSKRISGGLDITASLLGFIPLVPVSVLGSAADLSSRLIGKLGNRNKWWSLAPKISEVLSKSRIQEKCKKLEKELKV